MKNARKTEYLLDLEKPDLADILKPEAILSLSQEKIRRATTVKEALPELQRIAQQENFRLHVASEFNEAVDEMDRRNLNR